MSFEKQIQQWVAIDNQMKILNDNIKELRDKKIIFLNKLITILKMYNYQIHLLK